MDRSLPQRCSNWSSVPSLTRNLFMASDLAQMDRYGLIICRKDQLFNWLSEFKARAMKRSPGMAYIDTHTNSTQGSAKSMLFLIIQRPHTLGYIYIEYEICCILGANKFHVTPSNFSPNVVAPQVLGRGCCPWVFQHQSSKELAVSSQPSLGGMIYTKILRLVRSIMKRNCLQNLWIDFSRIIFCP